MSHFSVMVIGPDHEAQLQPYHEFECTGTNDQYVQNVDRTAEAREAYEKATVRRLRAPDGSLVSYFDAEGNWIPEFSREEEGGILPSRTYYAPHGYEHVEVPASEVTRFADWAADYYGLKFLGPQSEPDLSGAHKFGWIELAKDGTVKHVIDRTNPNKRWDWYQVGGRWTGFLKLKPGRIGLHGSPGLMTKAPPEGTADVALKRDVDFEAMRDDAAKEAEARWKRAQAIIRGREFETWKECRERFGEDYAAARDAYHAQAVVKEVRADREFSWDGPDEFRCSLQDYVARARASAGRTFAVVMDGKWYERGEMHWFAIVANEKDEDTWAAEFSKLVDGLDPDTLITIVDCHI